MRFLSVAERELRATARQRRTHRLRWLTAAGFLVLLAWLMWALEGLGAPHIFKVFAGIVFFYCLLFGTALTADCLSSEKREGTLGLLFLTNLNAPEIIAGKVCSTALAAAFGLFAIFPVLASQLIVGGITLENFWKTVLALVNVVFFAICSGILASSLCVRQFAAVASALGLVLFFSVGLFVTAALFNSFRINRAWANGVAIFSPLYSYVVADGGRLFGRNYYWWSILTVFGISSIWLGLATWLIGASWKDRTRGISILSDLKALEGWRQLGRDRRAVLRKRLLAINPFFWLSGPRQVSSPIFMLLTIVLVCVASFLVAPFFGRLIPAGPLSPMVGHMVAWFITAATIHCFVLYYAAMVASLRLAADKQTGALELVLSTPTSERSILRGLWLAYGRHMLFPAGVAILAHLFLIWQGMTMAALEPGALKAPAGSTPAQFLWHGLLNIPMAGTHLDWNFVAALRAVSLALILLVLVWITLGSLGPWLGLRMKHPGFAPLIAIALMVAPPILIFSFVCYCVNALGFDNLPDRLFVPAMIWTAAGIGATYCLFVSRWAAKRLRKDFRTTVTSRFQPAPDRPWWRPTRRGVFRFAIRSLSTAAALALIVIGIYAYQNWRHRRAWVAFQNELKQRNESLDLAPFLPAPVPENQNLARAPAFQLWAGVAWSATALPPRNDSTNRLFNFLQDFDVQLSQPLSGTPGLHWTHQAFAPLSKYLRSLDPDAWSAGVTSRTELASTLLLALEDHKELIRDVTETARLPYFQTFTNPSAQAVLQPATEANRGLSRLQMLLQIRSCALLTANQTNRAAEDLLMSLHLVNLSRQSPDPETPMRTQVLLMRALQPLWEGITQHRWTEPQLANFQDQLSRFNLLTDYTNAISRFVLAQIETWQKLADAKGSELDDSLNNSYFDDNGVSLWDLQPRAWWLTSCRLLYEAGQTTIDHVDAARGHVNFDGRNADLDGLQLSYKLLSLFHMPYWGPYPGSVVFAQTVLNQAIIACAAERYWLAHNRYPDEASELIPSYLLAIPNDVVLGRPLTYEKESDSRFILRGVGQNRKNDRGKPSDDWLWSFPTNAPPGFR